MKRLDRFIDLAVSLTLIAIGLYDLTIRGHAVSGLIGVALGLVFWCVPWGKKIVLDIAIPVDQLLVAIGLIVVAMYVALVVVR